MVLNSMDSFNKLNQKKLQAIANLSEDGLAILIDGTVKKYYHAYVNGDETKFNNAWNSLKEIIFMFKEDYNNIYDYINFCMVKYSNLIVKNSLKRDFELHAPFDVDFNNDSNAWNGLATMIRNSMDLRIDGADKVNLRNLKRMCVIGETIDEDMVELVNALSDSFNIKQEQYHESINEVLRKNGRQEIDFGDAND